jgi:NADH:ubiquinone oxidoreductase subunit K
LLSFAGFARLQPSGQAVCGQAFALFAMATTMAVTIVWLALALALQRIVRPRQTGERDMPG